MHATFILRIITERPLKTQKDIYLCFIDFIETLGIVRQNETITQLLQLKIDGEDQSVINKHVLGNMSNKFIKK